MPNIFSIVHLMPGGGARIACIQCGVSTRIMLVIPHHHFQLLDDFSLQNAVVSVFLAEFFEHARILETPWHIFCVLGHNL